MIDVSDHRTLDCFRQRQVRALNNSALKLLVVHESCGSQASEGCHLYLAHFRKCSFRTYRISIDILHRLEQSTSEEHLRGQAHIRCGPRKSKIEIEYASFLDIK